MRYYPESLARLLTELRKLPGVGEKTAQRLAFHMLREPAEDIRRLGKTIAEAHDHSYAVRHLRQLHRQDAEPMPYLRKPKPRPQLHLRCGEAGRHRRL